MGIRKRFKKKCGRRRRINVHEPVMLKYSSSSDNLVNKNSKTGQKRLITRRQYCKLSKRSSPLKLLNQKAKISRINECSSRFKNQQQDSRNKPVTSKRKLTEQVENVFTANSSESSKINLAMPKVNPEFGRSQSSKSEKLGEQFASKKRRLSDNYCLGMQPGAFSHAQFDSEITFELPKPSYMNWREPTDNFQPSAKKLKLSCSDFWSNASSKKFDNGMTFELSKPSYINWREPTENFEPTAKKLKTSCSDFWQKHVSFRKESDMEVDVSSPQQPKQLSNDVFSKTNVSASGLSVPPSLKKGFKCLVPTHKNKLLSKKKMRNLVSAGYCGTPKRATQKNMVPTGSSTKQKLLNLISMGIHAVTVTSLIAFLTHIS